MFLGEFTYISVKIYDEYFTRHRFFKFRTIFDDLPF